MEKIYQQFITKTLEANKKLKHYLEKNLKEEDYQDYNKKSAGGDISKNIDIVAENIFISYLNQFCNILSEESGLIKSSKNIISNGIIILDPLDGSDNFLSNLPYYGTSVSLRINNIQTIGVVYNLINNSYLFRTPYQTNFTKNSFLRSNFGIFERAYTSPDISLKLHQLNLKFRSPGATALSLAMANNVTFFLLAGKIREYDIDAALFICKELFIFQNEDFLLVSSNITIFQNIKEVVKGY
jgi:myo-inositol-1(or 4)-monophosphatase